MTLLEHLEKTGVSLTQRVGVIIESPGEDDTWTANFARVARLCTEIPENVSDHEDVRHYDPEFDLLLLWDNNDSKSLCILSMTEDAELFEIAAGGILIRNSTSRIWVGQNETFMDSACGIWASLGN